MRLDARGSPTGQPWMSQPVSSLFNRKKRFQLPRCVRQSINFTVVLSAAESGGERGHADATADSVERELRSGCTQRRSAERIRCCYERADHRLLIYYNPYDYFYYYC